MGKGRTKYGKTDANQAEIVEALRGLGYCTVHSLHAVGGGVPDLLVGIGGRNYLVEVKDGSKPPSARKLTPDQVDWHRDWLGSVHVFDNVRDVVQWAQSMR